VNYFKYRDWLTLVGVMALLPMLGQGQTRTDSVTINASVSEIVALSAIPDPLNNLRIETPVDPKTLTLTLSGSATDLTKIRIPILVRSNTGYRISAQIRSQAATVANFVVLDARSLGRFVAAEAIANLKVASELDRRATPLQVEPTAPNSLPLNFSMPEAILSGPRVSLAGTLQSADNALEVVIFIAVKPDPGASSWLLTLTLSGSATNRL
jgi:hypothetical protein